MPPRLPHSILADIAACIHFYTRVPAIRHAGADGRAFAETQWAAPVAGALVGLGVGIVAWLALLIGLPASLAAIFALGAGVVLTGALHEDGLADMADGFGGGKDRERKLAIMRDSHIGSYGALALGLSLLARWAALATLAAASPLVVLIAAIAAHAASRAALPALMTALPNARSDGLSAGVGRIDPVTARIAGGLGLVFLLPGGFAFAFITAVLVVALAFLIARLALSQIGGQTGDVLGAAQQIGEIAVLATAAAILT